MKNLTHKELSALSPEDLLDLINMADEMIAAKDKIKEYLPNVIQDAVHKSLKFIRCLFSGNGVGKTTACIQEAKWTALGTHPYRQTSRLPNRGIIVIDDASKADTVYLTNIRENKWYDLSKLHLDKKGRAHTQQVMFPNGSTWEFMTHEMAEDKWESIECDYIIFDEPPPRFIFVALMRGLRKKGSKPWIMFAGTPRGRHAPWMHKYLYKPWKFGTDKEIDCFFGSTDDNLHNLEPGTIERWEKMYTKEEMMVRRFGSFEFLSGRIFTNFSRDLHVEKDFPFPRNWKCVIAVDPHLRKNHNAIIIGVDPDGDLYVVRELETSLAGRRAARWFIDACDGFNVVAGICDNFGSIEMYADGDERKSFITLWNEEAMRMRKSKLCIKPTTRAQKRDAEWIEDMKDLLEPIPMNGGELRARIHIFESCVKLIDNFETYVWDEHTGRKKDIIDAPKEEPLGTSEDFLMCLKYGISMKPERLVNADRVLSRKMMSGRPQEYESHGYKPDWHKD